MYKLLSEELMSKQTRLVLSNEQVNNSNCMLGVPIGAPSTPHELTPPSKHTSHQQQMVVSVPQPRATSFKNQH